MFSVAGGIFCANELCWFTPDQAVAIGTTHQVLLVVHGAENVVAKHAQCEHRTSSQRVQIHRVTDQVVRLECVHPR